MKRNLYLVHEKVEALRCAFHTLVIRNEAIASKFPGGISDFAKKHKARFNDDLSVIWSMSGNDLEPLFSDLNLYGFDRGDAVSFDAASYLIGASHSGDYADISFTTPWLKGRCTKEGVLVSGTNQARLRDRTR